MTQIILNGEPMQTPHANLAELVDSLKLGAKRFAVEVNQALVPKSKLDVTPLTEGMKIEVVVAVGGG